MLCIVSQNRMRLTELHTVSIITPEHDREEDGVYKVYVNGIDFGHYEKKWETDKIMKEIIELYRKSNYGVYELPKGR